MKKLWRKTWGRVTAQINSYLWQRKKTIDFSSPFNHYSIVTDATERELGQSHASFSFQNGICERKHYFLAHLEPQPNGAAFASVLLPFNRALSMKHSLRLCAHGLTLNAANYQLLLRTPTSRRHRFSYQQSFQAQWGPYQYYDLPLSGFQPYFRGRYMPNAPVLEPSEVDTVGIRVVGRNHIGNEAIAYQKGLYGLAIRELSITGASST